MEIQGKNVSITLLKEGVCIDFGRGLGFDTHDRKVSRHHITFQLQEDKTKVGFNVTGKNPVWVYSSRNGEIRVYRSERGEMESGDLFCVSANNPVWFNLKRTEFESRELGFDDELTKSLQSSHGLPGSEDLEMEDGDLSNMDPIKEFGFVVMGHEFDGYPKKMIRDSKNWDWFLEEDGEKSDGDEDSDRKWKKRARKKRKKGEGDDDDDGDGDDDWTGESEDDAELITKLRDVQKPKYSTRSKDHDYGIKVTRVTKKSQQKDTTQTNETDTEDTEEAEEDEDETLGGFIVGDEGVGEEEEIDEDEEEEEEEEEFNDDDDEEE